MNAKDPIDRAVIEAIASLAGEIVSLKRNQVEVMETVARLVPDKMDAKAKRLVDDLSIGYAGCQRLAASVTQLRRAWGM